MMFYVFVYCMHTADYYEQLDEPWCVQRAFLRIVSFHDDAHEATIRMFDIINDIPDPILRDDECASVAAIPLCHDDHYLA